MLRKLLFIFLLGPFSVVISQLQLNYVEGEVLLQIKPTSSIQKLEQELWSNNDFSSGFRLEIISKNANIYLFQFNHQIVSHSEALSILKNAESVSIAQLNHLVQSRATTPNDPEFASQWHLENTGQTGGTPNSDISATDAWDITTGGLTVHGDTIVVCVIEEQGGNLTLPDLAPNAWKNHYEIPSNGIDDDNNGYVDDYLGWNLQGLNDDIGAGNHGTQVSSMIGSKGDNSLGGSGVNWDVKIMMIRGVSPASEASVLAAYDYPLTMRKLYNQSNGNLGAFVVATNASWGVDNGDPADYPLWCSFYDTLGVHGILNIGATANNNVDVDVVGDMPTACGSDYIVSVTATDHSDNRNFSGYGATTIDLGAPGQNTRLLNNSGNWGNVSGTSFATPCVAGAVALMYSIDCPSFMGLVKTNPQAATLMVRQALLDGVDNVPGLVGETVTGGRLNVFNAINELLGECNYGECSIAYNFGISNLTDSSARIGWQGISNSYWFYFKESSASFYDSILVDTNFVFIDTLDFCTHYNYYLITDCDTAFSNPTPVFSIKTDGCCESPEIFTDTITVANASFYWNPVATITDYAIRYRQIGNPTWTEVVAITDTFYNVIGLDSCENYELQIKSNCSQVSTSYSNSFGFKTKGCGACYDQTYCIVPAGDSNLEWIERIVLNDIDYTSGNNNGYLFTDTITTTLGRNTQYTLAITPGYAGFNFTETIAAWIDFNQNGDFEVAERILFASNNGLVSQAFTVPGSAVYGQTRMRLSLAANGGAGSACPFSSILGELEDYCIWIAADAGIKELENTSVFELFPNPANNLLKIKLSTFEQTNQYEIYDNSGKILLKGKLTELTNTIDISNLYSGIYYVKVWNSKMILGTQKLIKTF